MRHLITPAEFADKAVALRLLVFDFDGVFTDNSVYVFEDGREAVRCSRFDGIGLRRLERAGIEPLIISTETNPVVTQRARKLKIGCVQGIENKLELLTRLAAERDLGFDAVGYLGNDVNDRPCLARVALPMVVADAHADVVPLAAYITKALGGAGAVREVCDILAELRGVPSAYALDV
jgi:YrbI family 3-deoxy-D-manno-octulosonate 8-phosphate phosphatase